jgi:hypothetical protein
MEPLDFYGLPWQIDTFDDQVPVSRVKEMLWVESYG